MGAVRRQDKAAYVERQVGDLARRSSTDSDSPHLGGARSGGEEVEATPVGRPPGTAVRSLILGQSPEIAAIDADRPDIGAALVGLHIGLLPHEGDALAVG